MEKLETLEQIAKFAQNDRTPFECKCSVCGKQFVMQVRSLKIRKSIICIACGRLEKDPNSFKKIVEKRQANNLKKFGYKEFFQSENFKKKSKNTCLKKYGCEHVFQSRDFIDNALKVRHEKYGDVSFNAKYQYDDVWFDSSWELAYYIWLKDSKLKFEYHPGSIGKYVGDDEKEHHYFPDFIVEGEYQEIKGDQFFNEKDEPFDLYTKKFWWKKLEFLKENKVRIIRRNEMKFIFEYIDKTFGKNYLKKFKIQK